MFIKRIILILMTIVVCQFSHGQTTNNINHELYQLQRKMKKGDKDALFKIANYLDSQKELTEMLSYNHVVSTNESQVAKRILELNTLFTEEEIIINDTTSKQDFLNFLNVNKDKIYFSEYARAFLITPLELRNPKVEFREVTKQKKSLLKDKYEMSLRYVKDNNIDSLIKQKDPKALLLIASELYKGRDWLNSCFGISSLYVNILKTLTNLEIAVEDENNFITWHIEEEYHSTAALNLLCYFSANYTDFKWNNKKNIFENKNIQFNPIRKEDELFQKLFSRKKNEPIKAFIKLTTCDPMYVNKRSDEYVYLSVKKGEGLPTFPFRFLKQLVFLTQYCDENKIDFKGTPKLRSSIEKLKGKLSFSERRQLENKLIEELTLDEITAFEYWSLIYQNSWQLTYSAGRIFDVFYSKNWNKLLEDEKHLNCYLKKSALFNRLGIIGVCNNYLKKFANSSPNTLLKLENQIKPDEDIIDQISLINTNKYSYLSKVEDIINFSKANYDCKANDLEEQLKVLIENKSKSKDRDYLISEILSKTNYEQIPIALNAIENYSFRYEWMKYSFMLRDFGFFLVGDFDNKKVREEFLDIYSKSSEYELYSYYLDKAGIDYKTNKKLDFDKIYELIKYNVVVAFAGGGGSKEDNEVYSLIKLMEIHFNTTLGFPKKLCNSRNMYACDSLSRVKAWMRYLEENNLLKESHNEPISFNY